MRAAVRTRTWGVTQHAVERFIERHAPGLSFAEAKARLLTGLVDARPLRTRTRRGDPRWLVPNLEVVAVVKEEQAMRRILAGAEVEPTDKDYKIYVRDGAGGVKFYFQHLSSEQQQALVDAVNAGKVKFGYPGYFYVLPFFMHRKSATENGGAG